MRILIASDQFWPMVSGCATAGRNLAQGLAAAHHDVLVIAPSQTGRVYRETDGNYRITRTRSLTMPARKNIRISVSFQNEIRKEIEAFAPEVVHVHTQLTVGLTTLRIAKRLGIPIVATNHVMPENIVKNIPMLLPLARPVSYMIKEYGPLLYRGADHIIMPTQSAVNMFSKRAFGDVPVDAVSNGIDLSQFKSGPADKQFLQKFGIPADRPIAAYLGRLDAEKHLDILVRAVAIIKTRQPVRGLIIGAGNSETSLRGLARKLGLEADITFTGQVTDADRALLLRYGTVFVMPSPAELQSLATLEAMASGQPIVAVEAGALNELCHDGENGYLFKLDDPDDLAKQVIRITTNPHLRIRMSLASQKIAQTHELSHVIHRFEEIYESVITHKSDKTLVPIGA